MPRRVTADVPSEGDILRYNNVPVELAAKFIGWSDVTIRYALQEERAPFGIAAQNPKTARGPTTSAQGYSSNIRTESCKPTSSRICRKCWPTTRSGSSKRAWAR